MKQFDPRTKLIFLLTVSVVALLCDRWITLCGVLIASLILVGLCCGFGKTAEAVKRMRWLFLLVFLVGIFLILLIPGKESIWIGSLPLLSSAGVRIGVLFLLRGVCILVALMLLLTEDRGRTIQALSQWKLPYGVVFLCDLAFRIPALFWVEFQNRLMCVQYRGVDLKQLSPVNFVRLYGRLTVSAARSAAKRARETTATMEMRGFQAYQTRTSYLDLGLKRKDYAGMALVILAAYTTLSLWCGN